MSIWGFVGGGAVLFLIGVFVYERLPKWRAARDRALREPLTDQRFGEQFFDPNLSKIAAQIRRIASEQIGKDLSRIHPDDPLAQVLSDGYDSLDEVEMLMAIEDEFGVEIDEGTAAKIVTFRDLVDAVSSLQPFLGKWRREMGRAVEERFGVSLSRETLAKLGTPRELTEALARSIEHQISTGRSCQSQRAFYLIRRAIVETLHVARSSVTPATPLAQLIKWRAAPESWLRLRDAAGARQWPTLVRPGWVNYLNFGLLALVGAAILAGLPALAKQNWLGSDTLLVLVLFLSELRALLVVPALIGAWVFLVHFSERLRRSLPPNIHTVADLLPFVATSSDMKWTQGQIQEQVREILTLVMRVPSEPYDPDRRFVEDFGPDTAEGAI